MALAAVHADPRRFGVIGRVDLEAPAAPESIAAWRTVPGMMALRALCHPNERALLAKGRIDWLCPQAEAAGAPVMLYVMHPDLHFVDRIAARHPAVKLTIDHLGLPIDAKDEEAFRELDKLLVLARRPSVALKASCLQHHTADV